LKLPKDSFIPPDGWSFDGKWFVNPELRCVYEQMVKIVILTKKVIPISKYQNLKIIKIINKNFIKISSENLFTNLHTFHYRRLI